MVKDCLKIVKVPLRSQISVCENYHSVSTFVNPKVRCIKVANYFLAISVYD